jgi:branched-chain amino acid transport system ATP-binding protein
MLELCGLEAAYGRSQVLFGVDLHVGTGEVVTLLGRNGMGKTTTIHTLLGLVPAKSGTVRFRDQDVSGWPEYRIAQAGIGLVPEGRQVFPNLSVRENLVATAANRAGFTDPWTLKRVLSLFPRLAERVENMGNQLSGGEQQMLAIGRALMTNPRLLVLDEATEGLAPLIRAEIWTCLQQLKTSGLSILLVDKNLDTLLRIADRHHILEKGRVVWDGDSDALRADKALQHRHLGV